MSGTPETDAETMQDEWDHVDTDFGPFEPTTTVSADFARTLERERDEARERNAKLRDIAERAVAGLEAKYKLHSGIQLGIRAELDQLTEGGK
jgi:hypothetical protein